MKPDAWVPSRLAKGARAGFSASSAEDVPVPSPLSHLQASCRRNGTGRGAFVEIYRQEPEIGFDAGRRARARPVRHRTQAVWEDCGACEVIHAFLYRLTTMILANAAGLPAKAVVESDAATITELFGLATPSVQSGRDHSRPPPSSPATKEHVSKNGWRKPQKHQCAPGHENSVVAPQTVLIARRGGKRYRLLLYHMRRQGNDVSVYEFLAVDEVGGPTVGLPAPVLSLITAIRMGFRFRYELIDKFADLDWEALSPNERQSNVSEFQTILQNLLTEVRCAWKRRCL